MNKIKKTAEYFPDSGREAAPELEQKALLNILEDMQKDKEVIENQRKAILNTLEDVKQTQEQLQKRYSELNILKDLLQELGFALNIRDVFRRAIKALKQVMPESANFAYILPPSVPGIPSNLIYVHARAPLSEKYLDAVKWSIKMSFKGLPDSLRNKKELQKWISGDFSCEFLEGKRDDESRNLPLSLFNSSLSIGGEMLGFVNVSSGEDSLFTQKDINLVNTILGAAAGAVLRLRQFMESEEARIHSLVDGLTNGVMMFNTERMVTMMNPAAGKMTNLPAPVFPFSEFSKLFKDIDFEKKIDGVLERGTEIKIEEASLARFTYQIFITPVRDYEKNIIGGALVLHDITHIKEVERMKTEFVSVASHQLRTPLTAIKLFTEMLGDEEVGGLNGQQKDYMNNVRESTERMIRLVNDLLNVSRLETGRLKIEPEPVQMEDFIQNIITEAEPIAKEEDCVISFEKPKEKLPEISVDPILMRQVVHNLIMNAIQYSPVHILKGEDNGARKCPVGVKLERKKEEKEDYVIVSVSDKGIGIPEEARPRIFEKFFRADNAAQMKPEGSGLGLYVVKMVVEASGGKIWFESKEGEGTVFYVKIPIKGMVVKKGEKGLIA